MKKGLRIFLTIIALIFIWIVLASVSPVSYEKCIAESFSDDKILYESEDIKFGDNTGCIVSSVESNGEYYSTSIVEKTAGVFNNQNQVKTSVCYYSDSITDTLTNPNFEDMKYVEILHNEDASGCYWGIVPIECKSISFDGKQAELIYQSVTVEGKEFEFYLYYLPAEYKESCEIKYVDINNNVMP